MNDLINAYEEHKTTEDYQKVVERSKKQQERQKRVSHEIWWAQYNYNKGRDLSLQVRNKMVLFSDLDENEQRLVEDFETRESGKALDNLLQRKRPPYRGHGFEVQTQKW